MGFLSKIFKGVKKVFKSVGKAIKSAFNSVGKFMNKLGVVGQIGLLLAMPYIGPALGSLWSGIAGTTAAGTASAASAAVAAGTATATQTAIMAGTQAATATGLMAGGSFAQAVGGLMNSVGSFVAKAASGVGKTWSSITEGVSSFVTEFSKTAANKLGFSVEGASANFFGPQSSWSKTTAAIAEPWKTTVPKGFGMTAENYGLGEETFSSSVTKKGDSLLAPKPTPTFVEKVKKAAGEKLMDETQNITGDTVSSALITTAGEYAFRDKIAEEEEQDRGEIIVADIFSLESSPVAMASQTPIGPLQVLDTYQPTSSWAQQFDYFNTQGRAVA
jgi:hypothetical protein